MDHRRARAALPLSRHVRDGDAPSGTAALAGDTGRRAAPRCTDPPERAARVGQGPGDRGARRRVPRAADRPLAAPPARLAPGPLSAGRPQPGQHPGTGGVHARAGGRGAPVRLHAGGAGAGAGRVEGTPAAGPHREPGVVRRPRGLAVHRGRPRDRRAGADRGPRRGAPHGADAGRGVRPDTGLPQVAAPAARGADRAADRLVHAGPAGRAQRRRGGGHPGGAAPPGPDGERLGRLLPRPGPAVRRQQPEAGIGRWSGRRGRRFGRHGRRHRDRRGTAELGHHRPEVGSGTVQDRDVHGPREDRVRDHGHRCRELPG
uniref:Uncharacterized protein ORF14 n=1 Tax=Streptomyces bikiniensis TaxID=1896 RepID=Q5SFC6_STRBI|nr:hypothetical protein [Streptomyces bikiniensis]